MSIPKLTEELSSRLPADLAADLVNYCLQIKQDITTHTLERAAPGKFIETVVQVLQFLDTGRYDSSPKVDDYLKNLEARSPNLPDDLRVTLARVARANYTLRSKRSILHKGSADPNMYDLRYLYAGAQWILSELARQTLSTDMDNAGKLIEFIQIPVSPIVEDFGDKRLVLEAGSSEEELLILLLHYYPEPVPSSQILKDMDRRARSTVSNSITSMYRKRLVEGSREQGYRLTALGYQRATKLARQTITA